MVFGRTHTLLAAASLLQLATASYEQPGGDVTITKTVTNVHTVCPATTKPPVCKSTDQSGGIGSGGNTGGNYGDNLPPQNAQDDADLWEKWLERMSKEAAEIVKPTLSLDLPWKDWTKPSSKPKPTGSTGDDGEDDTEDDEDDDSEDDGSSGPGGFEDECIEPIVGKPDPATKCNAAGSRSKWCDGKSIETDYYKEYDSGNTCRYTLEITNTTLSFDKGPQMSFAINGQSPGPAIECNWGDWVEIEVINKLENNATAIHWHGIHHKHTNDQDGVPGVSECAVVPGSSRMYAFRASSYGTGWYHSHLLAQYGDGIRGPIIIHGPATADYDLDMGAVMISDLFPAGTAFAQADRIAHFGQAAVATSNYLLNGNNKSPDMKSGKHALWTVQKGKKHLFRIINGASQDAYSVHFDDHKFQVIAADFVPITPYETDFLKIAPGQRYDIILEADQPSANYFLRAITQTSCPSIPINTGLDYANGIISYEDADLTLPSSTAGNVTASTFATCLDEPIEKLQPYLKKSAGSVGLFTQGQQELPAGRVATATANQSVVQWFLNNNYMNISYTEPTLQSIGENPNLLNGVSQTNSSALIRNSIVLGQKNQWVYFIIRNQFFASHPMHLHGHDLSLLGQGNGEVDVSTLNFDNPTRRDTVMLHGARGPNSPGGAGPLGYSVIGFETDNPGAWLMHCHIVWHVEGGMALQFIERPSDIDNYAGKSDFKSECEAMVKYEEDPSKRKHEGQSGLKRNVGSMFGADVVRRDIHRHARSHL